MANVLVQFRADDSVRVQENGIPFSMKLDRDTESPALAAMKAASRIAEEQGIADMTLDEINAEIQAARQQAEQ